VHFEQLLFFNGNPLATTPTGIVSFAGGPPDFSEFFSLLVCDFSVASLFVIWPILFSVLFRTRAAYVHPNHELGSLHVETFYPPLEIFLFGSFLFRVARAPIYWTAFRLM